MPSVNGDRWQNRIAEHVLLKPGEIQDHPFQFRMHPKNQILAMEGVLNDIGIVDTLLVYRSPRAGGAVVAIDGHLRKSLNPTQPWPCTMLDVTDEEADAILATHDPLAALAATDSAKLDELLKMVNTDSQAVQEMLAQMAAEAGLYQEEKAASPEDPGPQTDRAEELQQKWQVESGDVWQVGRHVVICGDCRESDTWQRLTAAAGVDQVNSVFTSPPYAEQRKEQYGGVPADEYVDWWEEVQANVRAHLAGDGSFFVNIKEHSEEYIRHTYVHELIVAMVKCWGWVYLDEFCWERTGVPGDPNSMGKFRNQWEPVFWLALKARPKFQPRAVMHESDATFLDKAHRQTAAKYQGTGEAVVGNNRTMGPGLAYPGNRIKANNNEAIGHSGAFPSDLPAFFVKAYSDPGDVWLDPFGGSGTTAVAAHQNERRGLLIEKLPKYVAVTLERLQTVVGAEPEKVG